MTSAVPPNASHPVIRPAQLQDLDSIEQLFLAGAESESQDAQGEIQHDLQQIRRWYRPLKVLSLIPGPFQNLFCIHVAEQEGQVRGAIQVSPFNRTRSTWRIDRVGVDAEGKFQDVGSQLLRHCFEGIWEARTWLTEVDVTNKTMLALYRQNGFQPLAQMTYWAIAPERLQELAEREPDLPNLLPVSNADAQLLYQLDTAAMPPLMRQVFDRHLYDFKTGFLDGFLGGMGQWLGQVKQRPSGYVFEPQRKAAIGYFQIQISQGASRPHIAELTVHPAYTWLYPELICQMARIVKSLPASQSLQLVSADYQPEREEYLERLGAERMAHTLMMSRSVWHKLREARSISLEGLQLSEVLQGFQRTQKPIPGRMSFQPVIHARVMPIKWHRVHPKPPTGTPIPMDSPSGDSGEIARN